MERGRTPEYTSIRRWEISLTSEGSVWPTVMASSTRVAMGHLRLGNDHLGELAADEHAPHLVLGDVLGHHERLAAPLVLLDDLAAGAHAHARADGLQEAELHLGVEPGVHDVLAVTQVERLIGHERSEER